MTLRLFHVRGTREVSGYVLAEDEYTATLAGPTIVETYDPPDHFVATEVTRANAVRHPQDAEDDDTVFARPRAGWSLTGALVTTAVAAIRDPAPARVVDPRQTDLEQHIAEKAKGQP